MIYDSEEKSEYEQSVLRHNMSNMPVIRLNTRVPINGDTYDRDADDNNMTQTIMQSTNLDDGQ